jgi:hypothetical protein
MNFTIKSKSLALLALSLALSSLTSCGVTSKPSKPILNVYQPSVLTLPAGTEVLSEQGRYTAQTREVWHSDKRYRDLEAELVSELLETQP